MRSVFRGSDSSCLSVRRTIGARNLTSARSLGLALLVARLFVVLVLANFSENARLFKFLLEPLEGAVYGLVIADLDLRQRMSPLYTGYRFESINVMKYPTAQSPT